MKKNTLWFAIFLIIAAAATRVLRHFGWIDLPPNVAPVAAIALFGGTYLPRRLALVLPVAAMLLADLMIGFYTPGVVVTVYASFIASVSIGFWLRTHKNLGTVVGASLAGSVVFFLTTNFAVWSFGTWYPHTFAGLMNTYLAGIPFFRNTVLGDLAFVGAMFGAYEAVQLALRQRMSAPQQ